MPSSLTPAAPRPAAAIAAFADVQALAAADMAAVDALIRTRLASDVVLVNQVAEYIVGGGGKRLRPMLHLLAAHAAGYRGRDHLQLAAVARVDQTGPVDHRDAVPCGEPRARGDEACVPRWDRHGHAGGHDRPLAGPEDDGLTGHEVEACVARVRLRRQLGAVAQACHRELDHARRADSAGASSIENATRSISMNIRPIMPTGM